LDFVSDEKGELKILSWKRKKMLFLHLDREVFISDLITNPLIRHTIKIESNSFYAIFIDLGRKNENLKNNKI